MFEHSVKVPRHYKIAANIFKKVATEGGSVKTLLYDDKLRHFRVNVLYALITETIKHGALIDKLLEICNVLKNEPRLDPWLAKVLTAELLFGKKCLPGKSKPEQTIMSYKEQLEKQVSEHPDDVKSEGVRRPRYVRINTNLLTTSDAIGAMQEEGYRFIRCTSGSYNDYLEQIQKLTDEDFTQDYHVKTIFVFSSGTKMHEHPLYLENQIILQDKATAMAVHLLAPPAGSVVLDMCAAPGMKTTQLAAYMRNEGKIYAIERNESRYRTLCDFVSRTGCRCVQTVHKDALDIKRGDYDDVEYILLDPSCSGSGMELSIHNYIEESRLAKLTSLQEKFLKHAMNAFPKAKRIVYSTCSLFPEENERVITNTVKSSRSKWRVQDVKELLKGQWNNFGSSMYGSMGARCMYARPDSDLTTGFFLAVLDRDPRDIENDINRVAKGEVDVENDSSKKLKKSKHKEEIDDGINDTEEESNEMPRNKKKKHSSVDKHETNIIADDTIEENNVPEKKKKRKKNKSEETLELSTTPDNDQHIVDDSESTKKTKSKKHKNVDIEPDSSNINIETESEQNVSKKKKKSKKKEYEEAASVIAENVETENENHDVVNKKKNKKKDLEIEPEMDNDSEHNIPKKKKKKRD